MPGDDRPKRAPSIMGDEARANIGRAHRKKPTPLPFDAVPEPSDPDEVTSPVALLLRELTDDEQQQRDELCETQRISPQSPATVEQLLKVAAGLAAVKKQEKRDRRESANQALEVLGKKGPPIERLDALERKMRLVWALLGAAGTAAAGSIVTVGKGLYERGADEGALKIRLEHHERDAERLRVELRDLRDRLDDNRAGRRRPTSDSTAQPSWPLPTITPKGPTP